MVLFVASLRQACVDVRPCCRVLVYDSLALDGTIRWANGLEYAEQSEYKHLEASSTASSRMLPATGLATNRTTAGTSDASGAKSRSANQRLLEVADGLFLNYWWTSDSLRASGVLADTMPALRGLNQPGSDFGNAPAVSAPLGIRGEEASQAKAGRRCAVFAGVDVFPRSSNPSGTFADYSGFDCGVAVKEIADNGLSLAVFAPGWTLESATRDEMNKRQRHLECNGGKGGGGITDDEKAEVATELDARFWDLLDVDRVRTSRR